MFSYLLPKGQPEETMSDIPEAVVFALEFVRFCTEASGLCWSKSGDGPYEQEMHPAQDEAFREACGALSRYFRQLHGEECSGS
jgi:hypothetical protein